MKYTKCIICIILSEGIPSCNNSLESRREYVKVGMMGNGLSVSKNVLKSN
jgi:hypothetical protein